MGSILAPLGRPLAPSWPQVAPKIAQVVPKGSKKMTGALTFWGSKNRLASRKRFRPLVGPSFVNFGRSWATFWSIFDVAGPYLNNFLARRCRRVCQDLPEPTRISQVSARYLPGTSWSTIASTHRPHIPPPRHANQIPDRQDPKQGGGGDRPLAAFN